jgi:hypothetical protein
VKVVLDRDRLTAGVAMRAGLYARVSTVEQEPDRYVPSPRLRRHPHHIRLITQRSLVQIRPPQP